jgi:hypothetical protein
MLDKLAPITSLIVNHALCRKCIAEKAGLEPVAVDAAIRQLAQSVKIDLYLNGTCLDCRNSALVYAIDRPPPR